MHAHSNHYCYLCKSYRHCPVSATKPYAQSDSPLEWCHHQWTLVFANEYPLKMKWCCLWPITIHWNNVASGQWISTAIVLPSGTISRCHVDVRWYGVALWGRQSPWIHSSTQWIAYCPMKWCCHQVSVTAVSQIHALGECPLEWWCHQISAVPAMHRQFCAHNECCYNTILIKNCQSPRHQFHTHWMFTESPVSVVSPV